MRSGYLVILYCFSLSESTFRALQRIRGKVSLYCGHGEENSEAEAG